MKKPSDFDKAKAFGDFKTLPAGGYICKIIGVKETTSKAGSDMIQIAYDIAEGEYKDYFGDIYKKNDGPDAKWPASGTAYQVVTNKDGTTNGNFKAFTNAVVESNKNFEIEWDDKFAACFKAKLIGVVFRREEYAPDRWSIKADSWKSVDEIKKGDFKVPADKPLPAEQRLTAGAEAINDDDIPF